MSTRYKENTCSMFPDSWHWIIDFNISHICRWHDTQYEALVPRYSRKVVDEKFRDMLIKYNPGYIILWEMVYRAVRMFGWIPWGLHRMENSTGINLSVQDKWAKVRTKLGRDVPTITEIGRA